MSTAKIRAALVVIAVSVSSLAFAAPAQALTVKGSTTDVKWHFSKPKHDAVLMVRAPEGRSTIQFIDAGEVVFKVSAGGTGQGDSDEECGNRANLMNGWADLMNAAANNNLWPSVFAAAQNYVDEHEDALEAGCFIVYERRTDEPPTG